MIDLVENESNMSLITFPNSGNTYYIKLYTERVDENVIKVLVGHEKGFTMKQYVGEPFTPERLLEEISKVNYSGINWKKLKI